MKDNSDTSVSGYGYDVILTEQNGRCYLRIPELNLIVDCPDVTAAHAELDAARRKMVERHAALGLKMPPPRDARLRRDLSERVMPFMFKAAAVALVGLVLVISSAVAINYVLRDPLRHAAQKVSRAAVLQITAGLEDFARRDLTPDREERLRNGLRGAVPLLRPFIEEMQPLFADDRKSR